MHRFIMNPVWLKNKYSEYTELCSHLICKEENNCQNSQTWYAEGLLALHCDINLAYLVQVFLLFFLRRVGTESTWYVGH
jgi:hypothetical protein